MISLKIARIKKDMTQKQLGELVGVSPATINRIELGKQSIKLETLKKIAEILEVTVNELIEE